MDNVQYPKGTYVNRVKVKTRGGASWLTVPVKTKGLSDQYLRDAKITNDKLWMRKHLKTLTHNYITTPHFREYFPQIMDIVNRKWILLRDLNIALVRYICEILDIKTSFVMGSDLDVEGVSTDLLVDMVQSVCGDSYLCGGGAIRYQKDYKFYNANITPIYQNYKHPIYPQLYGDFIPGLSIIDALFNVGSEGVIRLLNNSEESKQ